MVVQGSFSIGIYKYARSGSISDWIVFLKVDCGASYESQSGIEAIASADQKDPIFLSRRETPDYVTHVRSQTGVNKNLAASIN